MSDEGRSRRELKRSRRLSSRHDRFQIGVTGNLRPRFGCSSRTTRAGDDRRSTCAAGYADPSLFFSRSFFSLLSFPLSLSPRKTKTERESERFYFIPRSFFRLRFLPSHMDFSRRKTTAAFLCPSQDNELLTNENAVRKMKHSVIEYMRQVTSTLDDGDADPE